jgi:diguanylate cyclase (GGDEF)-like protein
MLTTALAIGSLLLLYSVLYLYRRRGEAMQDMITGLPSRDFFERYLQQCAARTARRPEYGFAVLLLDIRGFPEMRRHLGRFTAEEVLADFAERVFWCIRPADVLTRLEGENFAIVLEDTVHVGDATAVAMRVQRSMTEAVTLAARQVAVDVNVGVTLSKPGTVQNARALIQEAETALARAIETGRPYVVHGDALPAHHEAGAD